MIIMVTGSLVGCGTSGHSLPSARGTHIVDVAMHDIGFSPAVIQVKTGETVTFVFHNTGKLVHEALLGDEAAQAKHEQEMGRGGMAGMHGMNDDDFGTTVAPGQTATLTHTFTRAGSTIIGCHEPGHYNAGMRLTVKVS